MMAAHRARLIVEPHALTIGGESIGLPTCTTADVVIDKYLELLARLRPAGRPRADDLATLAAATGYAETAVANLVRDARVAA